MKKLLEMKISLEGYKEELFHLDEFYANCELLDDFCLRECARIRLSAIKEGFEKDYPELSFDDFLPIRLTEIL